MWYLDLQAQSPVLSGADNSSSMLPTRLIFGNDEVSSREVVVLRIRKVRRSRHAWHTAQRVGDIAVRLDRAGIWLTRYRGEASEFLEA